jgi:hypothetical protein
MTGGDVHGALARLLCDPVAMGHFAGQKWDSLRGRLGLDGDELGIMRAVDPEAMRRYLVLIQRRRLESLADVFPASMGVLCERRRFEVVAREFWNRCPRISAVSVDRMYSDDGRALSGYIAHQAGDDLPAWLADLARYELMRSEAIVEAAPSGPVLAAPGGAPGALVLRLAPGVRLESFGCDVAALHAALRAGQRPQVSPKPTWLLAQHRGDAGLRVFRLGPGAGRVLAACNGVSTFDQVLASAGMAAGSQRAAGARSLVLRLLQERVLSYATSAAGDRLSREGDHAGGV